MKNLGKFWKNWTKFDYRSIKVKKPRTIHKRRGPMQVMGCLQISLVIRFDQDLPSEKGLGSG